MKTSDSMRSMLAVVGLGLAAAAQSMGDFRQAARRPWSYRRSGDGSARDHYSSGYRRRGDGSSHKQNARKAAKKG